MQACAPLVPIIEVTENGLNYKINASKHKSEFTENVITWSKRSDKIEMIFQRLKEVKNSYVFTGHAEMHKKDT